MLTGPDARRTHPQASLPGAPNLPADAQVPAVPAHASERALDHGAVREHFTLAVRIGRGCLSRYAACWAQMCRYDLQVGLWHSSHWSLTEAMTAVGYTFHTPKV
jgi:hypothetical protein